MTWQQWILAGLFALGALLTVGTVGKRRKVITPSDAVLTVLIDLALIWMIVTM